MLGLGRAQAFAGTSSDEVLTETGVLRDPEIPPAGNKDGDITIVEYFDYNCPYCRKLAPELAQVVHDDGKVRMIFKDWPILGPSRSTPRGWRWRQSIRTGLPTPMKL